MNKINMDKIKTFGQIFTPENIAKRMISLSVNKGEVLEPSAGEGIFTDLITDRKVESIEIDTDRKDFISMDFFNYSTDKKFSTIIGNPPYVAYNNISMITLSIIRNTPYLDILDDRSNLYMFFIRKCLEHLDDKGELIFITPRDMMKSTSAIPLNSLLYKMGTITHWYEYGDQRIFDDVNPNVVIWRFEKNNFSRETKTNNGNKEFICYNGQISFIENSDEMIRFGNLFDIKVGAVSGRDSIFEHKNGNKDFVCSYTKRSGKLKTMYYNIENKYLEKHKEELLNRKIKTFTEKNWYMWGRGYYESDKDRIYVNCKTRDENPFFTHDCKNYDGSILAIFPKIDVNINVLIDRLNKLDWESLGFKVGGRYIFSQRALENALIPNIKNPV